ncbi:MAG TPA: hypothetical protein VFX02_02905 [Gammaproteobacteria bacterium]|nr:hypothetical protein [Gammaproteobacteria bacterium]
MKLGSNINGGLRLCLAVCGAIACLSSWAAYACEGAALEEANTLYDHFQLATMACNESGSVQDAMNCMAEEWEHNSAKVVALPEDCRDKLMEFAPSQSTE